LQFGIRKLEALILFMEQIAVFVALALVLGGVVALIYFVRQNAVVRYQQIWLSHNVKSYVITLRHGNGFIDKFDSEELGSGTTLMVIDDQVVNVNGQTPSPSEINTFQPYRVEGLFKRASSYRFVDYDSIYGFPTRMGTADTWTIEVTDFQPL
jgi:hypothetical protein